MVYHLKQIYRRKIGAMEFSAISRPSFLKILNAISTGLIRTLAGRLFFDEKKASPALFTIIEKPAQPESADSGKQKLALKPLLYFEFPPPVRRRKASQSGTLTFRTG